MSEKSQKILVVDDELPIQKLLSYGLEELGYKVIVAGSGEDALRLIASDSPNCLLLDVGLPKMDGIETLRELRTFSQIPVIMLTVENDDEIKVNALDLGADDYVTKPFSMPVLRARIQAVIRRHTPTPRGVTESPLFTHEHLKVDFDSHKIWVNGKEIHLTVTEFDLLSLFIQNRGRILTHQSFLKKIWGDQAGDQMHYLRVYINNLRRKVELNPSIPKLIVTEPGIGYRFESGRS
jgi:two-component system KDP operon response regulator KdpE